MRLRFLFILFFSSIAVVSYPGGEELVDAIHSNDIETIKQVLKEDPHAIHYHDPLSKWSPLHVAASSGYTDIMQLLIEAGIEIDGGDCFEVTPLHQAVLHGHEGACRLLLDSGADLNLKGPNGWTPLYLANYKSHYNIVQLLRDKGATN